MRREEEKKERKRQCSLSCFCSSADSLFIDEEKEKTSQLFLAYF